MVISGYLDGYQPPFQRSPLIDGSGVMAHALFWPAFLYTVGGSSSAPSAFDVDPADLSELIDTLLDSDSWPVFSLKLAGRSRLHVIMRNFPEEGGVDYVLDPGNDGGAIPLAAMEGHFRGPALAWSELVAATHQADQGHSWGERLLLLLPSCADSDRPSTAIDMVAAALTSVGAGTDARRVGAELLSSRRYWTQSCQWTTINDVLVCLGSHAYRSLGSELSPSDLRLVTEAFTAGPGHS
ncbi:hypothetical protein [Micromonospora sediminicola]|uniref:hypothetical protein n=1 Tax=Micromonospora sediminicola TaxID=946078 RepID=UPI0037BBCB4B